MPKPPMEPQDRDYLVNYYWNDVRRTEVLLGRRLPWPNFEAQEAARLVG